MKKQSESKDQECGPKTHSMKKPHVLGNIVQDLQIQLARLHRERMFRSLNWLILNEVSVNLMRTQKNVIKPNKISQLKLSCSIGRQYCLCL